MGPGHHVWWFHVSSSDTRVFSDMSSTINKPTWVCLKMFGKARNANGSWSIFQLKIAIRWLTYGWSRCRNGTIPQYLSGILLFPCFLWSCHNHVRIVVSYPYHMIYIYIYYIPMQHPSTHCHQFVWLDEKLDWFYWFSLEIKGSQWMFPSNLREQPWNGDLPSNHWALAKIWDGNGWDDMGLTRKCFIYAWLNSI